MRPVPVLQAALVLAGLCAGGVLAQDAIAPVAAGLVGDPAAGKKLSAQCRTCHGANGVAVMPVAPNIGGEPVGYLVRQLSAFHDGTREHEMMSVVAASLSPQQIADVAAFYAGFRATGTPPAGAAPPALCVDCHGADGIAVIPDAPNLAGETAMYVDTQLKAFRSGKRVHEIMTPIAAELTDSEIRELADYYGSTRLAVSGE